MSELLEVLNAQENDIALTFLENLDQSHCPTLMQTPSGSCRSILEAVRACCRNGDDGPAIAGFNLDPALIGQPSRNVLRNSSAENDYYTFSARGANRNNVALAKGELDRVKAVPNPYFAHSAYELDQFNRVVKFTHLPPRCTIRLFSLAGDLVRVIEKNDGTSQATWNLETNNGLPVGSGIYVFHVEAPGIGNKIGKVAVFVEKERLNNY